MKIDEDIQMKQMKIDEDISMKIDEDIQMKIDEEYI